MHLLCPLHYESSIHRPLSTSMILQGSLNMALRMYMNRIVRTEENKNFIFGLLNIDSLFGSHDQGK